VQLAKVGGGSSKATKVALAAVAGIAVVGLVLVLASRIGRRET
jgi:hypothetical protein